MPELPDIDIYAERLHVLTCGQTLRQVRLQSVFVLRTAQPPLSSVHGRPVTSVERLGKQLVIAVGGHLYLLIHLMIAGRLSWRAPGAAIPRRNGLAAFDFDTGTLLFTEAGKKKRASLRVVEGETSLRFYDRGGLEVQGASFEQFAERLRAGNHTLKRALTDQRILSGIGNAYSDEILHRARLSPARRTQQLDDRSMLTLYRAVCSTLSEWTERLRQQVGDGLPEKVTAFRLEMAVHGKYGQPCPVCGTKVQRIVYAENESNYCATCQTGGKLLADRALSRLLKQNWPKRVEDLEN